MSYVYEWPLVAFSVFIAIVASFATLRLSSRLAQASREALPYWVWGGACLMGLGIWATHFVGMLAMHPPIALGYDPVLTLLSVVPAVLASAIALHVLRNPSASSRTVMIASVFMGLGISAMHYTGMTALQMSPSIAYRPVTVVLSVLIAMGASWAALHLVFRERGSMAPGASWRRMMASVVMGLAIVAMHYTGMAAAQFAPDSVCGAASSVVSGNWLALLVGGGSLMVLGASLGGTFMDALQEQNTFYKALLNAKSGRGEREHEGVFVLEYLHIVFANESMCRISGYSEAELRERASFLELFTMQSRAVLLKPLGPAVRDDLRVGRHVVTLLTKKRRRRLCELTITAFEYGERTRFLVICSDITEHISSDRTSRSREEDDVPDVAPSQDTSQPEPGLASDLRESEARLQALQHIESLGSWEFDPASGLVRLSEEALRIYEIDPVEGKLSPSDLLAVVHPDDRDFVRQSRKEAFSRGGVHSYPFRLMLPGGRIKHVRVRGVVERGPNGSSGRIIGTLHDLTGKMQAEQSLMRLAETLEERVLERTQELDTQRTFIEAILDTAATLMLVLDARGSIVRFNRACEQLSGYRFDELRGKPIWETVIPPEHVEEFRSRILRYPQMRSLLHDEAEWLTRSGERRLVAWSSAPMVNDQGELEFVIITGIDITDRKRAERALLDANAALGNTVNTLREAQAQLVQAEKMASLGSLVAGISHEINTPIGIGVTFASSLQEEFSLLQREFEAGITKRSTLERFITQGLKGCQILVRNMEHAADLIRSFKQVAVDQSSDERRTLNLHDYVDEIILSLNPRLKGGKVRVENASDPGLQLETHPGALYQILSNLILNSLTHAYEPDQAGVIRIAATRDGDEVQILYSDDGKGVPEAIQDRIFDPFFTTRRGQGGTGLGLHIVFNLVASTLKGSIVFVKNAPRGASFIVRFPLNPGPSAEQS